MVPRRDPLKSLIWIFDHADLLSCTPPPWDESHGETEGRMTDHGRLQAASQTPVPTPQQLGDIFPAKLARSNSDVSETQTRQLFGPRLQTPAPVTTQAPRVGGQENPVAGFRV